jgi:predicted exporter
MKRWAVIWFLCLAAIAGGLSFVSWSERLSANVGDLLPQGEAVEGRLVRSWVQSKQSGIVWAVLDAPEQADAVWAFVESELRELSVVEGIYRLDTTDWIEDQADFWWSQRLGMRFPQWWDQHLDKDPIAMARTAVAQLDQFLAEPDAFVWDDLIPGDPLLLIPSGFSVLHSASGDQTGRIPLMLSLRGDPLDPLVQEVVMEAMDSLQLRLQEEWAGADWRYSGVVRFAQANREGISAEVGRLNLSIFASVLLLMFLLVRSVKPLLVVALVVAGSVICGAAAVVVGFAQIHVLALVLGAILAGIAADYAIHTITGKGPLKAILFPLLLGFLSTAIGFSLFLVAPLPLFQQTGVFVLCGLIGALLTALALRAWLQPADTALLGRRFPVIKPPAFSPLLVVPIIGVLAVWAVFRMSWTDDLRMLEYPTPELYALEADIQAQIHVSSGSEALLVTGRDWREARGRLSEVLAHVETEEEAMLKIWEWIPNPVILEALDLWLVQEGESFAEALAHELDRAEFEVEVFAPFFEDWQQWRSDAVDAGYWDRLVAEFSSALSGPLLLLFSAGEGEQPAWFSLTIPESASQWEALESLPGVVRQSQLSHLNTLFAQYRSSLMWLIVVAAVVMAVVLSIFLRFREFVLSMVIVCGALSFSFALISLWRTGLDLFDLMGAFLGGCLILDYTLFALNARRLKRSMPVSIHLSAATTASSFLWLSSSSVAAVQHLGQTVSVCVIVGWLLTWIFVNGKD